jgi:hypothetical protein
MLEADWWACTAPEQLLRELPVEPGKEKLRQFALACCRRVSHLLADDRALHFLGMAERAADGQASLDDLRLAGVGLQQAFAEGRGPEQARNMLALQVSRAKARGQRVSRQTAEQMDRLESEIGRRRPGQTALAALRLLQAPVSRRQAEEVRSKAARAAADGLAERRYQAGLIRCLFGNPFRPVNVCPEWLTPPVRCLAGAVAEGGGALEGAALADALEEAGCADEGVLAHCRCQDEHDRACWLLGLLSVE